MAKRPKLGAIELNLKLKTSIIEKLELCWSPEQIAGWLKVKYARNKRMWASNGAIYKSLYIRSKNVIHHSYTQYLRRKHPMRQSRYTKEVEIEDLLIL